MRRWAASARSSCSASTTRRTRRRGATPWSSWPARSCRASRISCRSRTGSEGLAPAAEEAALRPRVRMPVIRDVAHVVVHVVLAHLGGGDVVQARPHVLEMLGGRDLAVPAPDHHGHVAHVALGDPAHLVLVIPVRHADGAAEIAAVDAGELACHRDYAGPTKPMYVPHACSGGTSMACSPVLRTPRAGGGTPWSAIQRAAPSMLLVRYRTWNGPGPRRRSASSAGPGSAGWATVRPVGPRSKTAMSALMTAPPWIGGTGIPRTWLYALAAAATSGTAT